MQPDSFYHQSVLLQESITQLNIQPQGTYLDATFGGGGHSKAILEKLGPTGKLIVFDQDADAQRNLPDDPRLIFIPENFRYAARFVRMHKLGLLHGVLADLGVSSFQFDTPERGFSIRFDAALDMRMDQRQKITAADVLNTYSEKNLIALFENYGEITNAKLLVKRILEYKNSASLQTIQAFKQLIAPVQYGNPNKYLAQVFQALRIEVNDELGALKEFLETMTPCLAPSGRMVIITFHSLEDRLVKQWMKEESFGTPLPFENKKKRSLQVISKKPILPGIDEEKSNPRARSAKLRVAERIL